MIGTSQLRQDRCDVIAVVVPTEKMVRIVMLVVPAVGVLDFILFGWFPCRWFEQVEEVLISEGGKYVWGC